MNESKLERVERLIAMFPTTDADFDRNGDLTDEAEARIADSVKPLLSKPECDQLAIDGLTHMIDRYLQYLEKVGAMKAVREANGEVTYLKLRDWTNAEAKEAAKAAGLPG